MTAQTPDVLVYEGRTLDLFSNPLEGLWGEGRSRPRFVPGWTSCWRGYVATWTLESGKLFLIGIEGQVGVDRQGEPLYGEQDFMQERLDGDPETASTRNASLQLLFPGTSNRVFAEWFSGELRIPEGERVHYEHLGYQSVYESEMRLTVERGVVVQSRRIETGQEFRRQAEAVKSLLDQPLTAGVPDAEGWVTCPHCNRRFATHDRVWDGERHLTCGGRVFLEGTVTD